MQISFLPHFFRECHPIVCVNSKTSVNLLYFNVRSLLPKLDQLRVTCSVFSPDIVCIVESWLDDTISDNEIFVQGYSIVRLDRSKHGGGVLIYVKDLFICSPLFNSLHATDLYIDFMNNSLAKKEKEKKREKESYRT